MKGVIYIMSTALPGLIKIGQTQTSKFNERMRYLKENGYRNITNLQPIFAIEVEDYKEKEKLLHTIFENHRVGNSELFAIDSDIVEQLLLALDGKVIYPINIDDKEKQFKNISRTIQQNKMFTFYKKGIKKGEKIAFKDDTSIQPIVVGEREVEYNGQIWTLSGLAKYLYTKMGKVNKSGSYAGSRHFMYKGILLSRLPDVD